MLSGRVHSPMEPERRRRTITLASIVLAIVTVLCACGGLGVIALRQWVRAMEIGSIVP